MRWFPLHTMQGVVGNVVAVVALLYVIFCSELAANVREAILVLVNELVLSSVFAFIDVSFIKACASAFCFNQSLKSRIFRFTPCFWTVKSDQVFFILRGNFCTAVLSSEALSRSASHESD